MKLTNSVIGWLLLLCLSVQTFRQVVVWIYFQWNREAIVLSLCENRGQPQMQCGGRCQLAKRLKATEEERGSSSHRSHKTYEETDCLANLTRLDILSCVHLQTKPTAFYQWIFFSSPLPSVFRPPGSF